MKGRERRKERKIILW